MKAPCFLLIVMLVATSGEEARAQKVIPIVPGVTYYHGPEDLDGKLVFLKLDRFSGTISDQTNTAFVYEFDLRQRSTREKVQGCPYGRLHVAPDGGDVCVVFGEARSAPYLGTNVFLYSESDKRARIFTLGSVGAEQLLFVGNHVLFSITSNGTILDYNVRSAKLQMIALAGASRWTYEDYKHPHIVPGQTNIVQFAYTHGGKRLAEGIAYEAGMYTLDLDAGKITPGGATIDPQSRWALVAADGRYVFFAGADRVWGRTLISSPWNYYDTERDHPKAKEIRVLKRFPMLSEGRYCLEQLSPCRRFALVRHVEQVTRSNDDFCEVNTYYMVNVQNGATRILIKDDITRKTGGWTSQVFWVGTNSVTAVSPTRQQPSLSAATTEAEENPDKAREEFFAMRAAVLRRFGQEAKAQGYKVVFTDIGPESLERDQPKTFQAFAQQVSGRGVEVRGFGRAVVDTKSVRDKKTGEKGAAFMFVNVENDDRGGYKVTAMWWDAEDKTHDVTYQLTRDRSGWKAQ